MSEYGEIIKLILKCEKFLISSHTHPDGDSIGSQLAFASILRELGKDVLVADQDPVPQRYRFLSDSDDIVTRLPSGYTCDAVFVLDSASLKRIGSIAGQLPLKDVVLVNIDHHISNDGFGHIVFVRPERSSTSEIIYELVTAMDIPVGAERAEQLYTGILTDTGSFHHPNTTLDSFLVSASLVKSGADPSRIADALYSENSVSRMRLLGLALSHIDVTGEICSLTLTREMVQLSGASMDESEDFVDLPLSLKGIKIGLLFREQDNAHVRISFRSRDEIDVDEIARYFGGGGHEAASGCIVDGEI
ncbi:MAG: bifunctional oligoribonuclease/PAP phosphatase NrnA, partial [bacterium]